MGKAVLVLVASALAAACSPFTEASPSPSPDAGAGAGDGGAPDAGAGNAALSDASAASYCATKPPEALCFDFDHQGGVATGWSGTTGAGTSSLTKEGGIVRSMPFALRASATGTASHARLFRSAIPLKGERASVESDLYVEERGGTSGGSAHALAISQGTRNLFFFVLKDGGLLQEFDGAALQQTRSCGSTEAIPTGTWFRAKLELDLGSREASVSINGALGCDLDFTLGWTATPFDVILGPGYVEGAGTWTFRFDNVLVH